MRFIMRNKEYGLKVVAPSEACRDNILKSAKKINGDPVWEQFSVLPDEVVPKHTELSKEELLAMLEAKEEQIAQMNKAKEKAAKAFYEPQPRKRGPKPKVKHEERTEESHGLAEETDQKEEG